MKRKQKPKQQATDPAEFAPKASGSDLVLHSRTIGALPIINRMIEQCRLYEILSFHLPAEDSRNRIETATAILLLVRNVLISREPLYGVGQWAAAFVPELLQLREDQLKSLNDDRVGRALDRLFDANFPDLVMDITRNVIREFDLDLSELHNDSTTIRFFGDYDAFEQPQMRRGKATVAIRQGHSKDHRHDLKQLLYILTVTDEGRRFITILPKNRSEPRAMCKTLLENPESLRWVLLYEVEDERGVLRHRFKSLRAALQSPSQILDHDAMDCRTL